MCDANIFLAVIAIIFPPLPVWVKRGLCSADSLINLALCCLAFVPGLLHSWYIIYTTPDYYEYERVIDVEGGHHDHHHHHQPRPHHTVIHYTVSNPSPKQQAQQGYGSMGPSHGPTAGQSASNEVPPTYNEAIKGDNKIQRT